MELFRVLGGTLRLVLLLTGFLLLVIGALLTITFVGAIIGVPLIAAGLILIVFGFFIGPRRRGRPVKRAPEEDVIDVKGERL